jgi:hypothetical protein
MGAALTTAALLQSQVYLAEAERDNGRLLGLPTSPFYPDVLSIADLPTLRESLHV